jgi:hypothetical protein
MAKLSRISIFFVCIYIACTFSAGNAFGACHAVTPSGAGSKTGADWNNAYAGLPGTLVRGDVYYLADGSYGSMRLSQAVSGTSTIEVRKAQSYDNGSTCASSIAAGWNTATMGSGQAKISGGNPVVSISANYMILNGNGKLTAQGCGGALSAATVTSAVPTPSDCGIQIYSNGSPAGSGLLNLGTGNVNNVTIEYVEMFGAGDNSNEQYEEIGPFSGSGPLTFTHIYGHNAGCVYFQDGAQGRTISESYFWGTEVNGASGGCHGQFSFEDGATSNISEFRNVYRDITGTAIWTFANSSQTHNNLAYFDNVIWSSSFASGASAYGHLSDGLLACINSGTVCTNVKIYGNTIVNEGGSQGVNDENANGSYSIMNNLWYAAGAGTPTNLGFSGNATSGNSNNSFLMTGWCPSGTGNHCAASASNPFTNWAGNKFTLTSDNANWNGWVSVSAPYNMDAAGDAYTTDRGAYQYVVTNAPATPTNVTGTPVAIP